jgi:uncharacterized protein
VQPDPLVLDELVRRVVTAVHPLQIFMFGSAARGEMTRDSDIDLLVVMPEGTHKRRIAQFLYGEMVGTGVPVDIVVATPSILERHKATIGLIYTTVLTEGRCIYAA